MYRSSSSSSSTSSSRRHHQEWSVSGEISYAPPVRLPKYVTSRSAQYRLKNYGPSKPTAVVRPFPAFSSASTEVWEKLGVRKTEFEWTSLLSKGMKKHEKKERVTSQLKGISESDEMQELKEEEEEIVPSKPAKAFETVSIEAKKKANELEFQLKNLENQLFAQQSHIHMTREELMKRCTINEALEKDKKLLQDLLKKTKDVHHETEQQLISVTKSNASCEQKLDLSQNAFQHERSLKNNIERENRRLELELKTMTALAAETETMKRQLQAKLGSKQEDLQSLLIKLEVQQQSMAKFLEDIKKLQDKCQTLEQKFARESQARSAAEQSEAGLRNELDKLATKFEQVLSEHAQQLDANRAKEQELLKLKQDYGKAVSQHEVALAALKQKYSEQISSLEQQIALLQSEKQKLEKSRIHLQQEVSECNANIESLTKEKQNMELKKNKMELKAFEYELKVEEQNGTMAELAGQKQKLAVENGKLLQQLADADSHVSALESKKHEIQRQLDDASAMYDKVCEERKSLKDQTRHLTDETERLRTQILLVEEDKEDITRLLNRSNTERQTLATKLGEFELEKEADLEQQKTYYEKKLSQFAEENDTLTNRVVSLEKIRMHLKNDVDDLQQAVDTANSTIIVYEKKIKVYEKSFEEWERKCNEVLMEMAMCQEENRILSSMSEKLQRYLAEAGDQITVLKSENDNIQGELRTANAELAEAADKVREAENQRRRIADENESLNKSLEASEQMITTKAEKIARMQKEIDNINTIVEERIAEKAAEFESTKKTLKETIDILQTNWEDESTSRIEAVKQRKAVEKKLDDVEVLLEQANLYRVEAHTHVKRLQEENKNLTIRLERSQQSEKELKEKLTLAEKKSVVVQNERDEIVAALKQVESARKDLESKVIELDLKLSEKSVDAEFLSSTKRKIEADLLNLQSEMEFTKKSLSDAERKAAEADLEIHQVKDRLVHEQENLSHAEQTKRDLETKIIELQNQVELLERNASASVQKAFAKMQLQVNDLEGELKVERRKHLETQKQEKHAEKYSKELQFLLTEEKQRAERMSELVETLERKLQVFKRQREDAEQMASINSTRCRTLRSELGGASERADAAEQVLNKIRADSKARVLGVVSQGVSYSSSSRASSIYSTDRKYSTTARSFSSVR